MANYSSSYTEPIPADAYYYDWERYQSVTPAPSPWGPLSYHHLRATPQWPLTRAHVCNASSCFGEFPPRPSMASPWYTSESYYSTPNINSDYHSHKSSWATQSQSNYEYRPSYANPQASKYCEEARNGYATGYHYPIKTKFAYIKCDAPADELHPRRPAVKSHIQRSSGAIPQHPSTTLPVSLYTKMPRPATKADAKKYKIPIGYYSLRYWDPSEEPILLLGSVFDANSLGKWIFDWTVCCYGLATPISDIAGELWILLIQLAGKTKRAETHAAVNRIRANNRELIDGFIKLSRYLTDKLRNLLRTCELLMLKAESKKGNIQLVKNAGVVFVKTLFGRKRKIEKTKQFMQGVCFLL